MSVMILKVDDSMVEKVKKSLEEFPKDKVEVVQKSAFGILKNRVKDPVAWQKKIREEAQREIYKEKQ